MSELSNLVLALINDINTKNYDDLLAMLSPEFVHGFLPASLGKLNMGAENRNREQFIAFLKAMEQSVAAFGLQPPLELFESRDATGRDTVIAHLVTDGKSVSGKPFLNEYIMIIKFDGAEGSRKIWKISEFVDSKYSYDRLMAEMGTQSQP
ncbi:hypothetical protein CPB85DRAFT_1248553 [Mucidula mucida]|nr:hypothetical protein CPB85DRAFT_1248553 [Mucidula mucida]